MTPRVGDVVRHYGHNVIARVVSIEYDNRPLYNLSVNGYDGILEGELEVLTMSELFEAAGYPVPEGGKLLWHRNEMGLVRTYWTVESNSAVGFFDPGVDGGWRELSIQCVGGIDLSRLPAGDAWDALPDVVKAVVK